MKTTHYLYIKQDASTRAKVKRKMYKAVSLLLVFSGLSLMVYVVAPILQWQLFYAANLSSGNIIAPIPKAITLRSNAIGSVLASGTGDFDSINANNWFPTASSKTSNGKSYAISIPKLGIEEAKVIVGAEDLSNSLIHYGGSSMPGEYGNAVIFGHSVLPQFFNPKNYTSIFSTLHTLKKGDRILITYDGVTYQYSVYDFLVVDPSEISVLEQTYDNTYLTIITCTPPGTYWKRLVVKAKIDRLASL